MIQGRVRDAFHRVEEIFEHQIATTDGGASLAVFHHGELVVDLWGGKRDDQGTPWTRDTLAMCFSTTKGVMSTAAHVLADRGLIDYDEPVATYWPEFAQNGKSGIPVSGVQTCALPIFTCSAIRPGCTGSARSSMARTGCSTGST